MGVVKSNPPEKIEAAIHAGLKLFGENKAQELAAHQSVFCEDCRVHFIGHLQRNKVRQVLNETEMVQSLDRISLAKEINRCASLQGRPADVLVEINIGREAGKSGVFREEAEEFIYQMSQLGHLHVRGLMCIPPLGNILQTERYFDETNRLFLDIKMKKIDNVSMDILSMGMSSDYLLAIKHGSTMVRIGKAIFGERM
jgi:pyridoxal phosphate enzyme (YggS family)